MPVKSWMTLIFTLILSSFSVAGTKPSLSSFEKNVAMGMEKTEVIDKLGSPRVSSRWHGKDRWVYYFSEKKGSVVNTIKKEVHFRGGIVVYIGDPPKPTGLSAEEQDELNLKQVQEDDIAWQKHQQATEDARREYEEWVNKVKNHNDRKDAYVPQFKNVD